MSDMKQLQSEFYRADAAHRFLSRADQERLFRRWLRQSGRETGPVSLVEQGLPAVMEGVLALLVMAAIVVLLGRDHVPMPEWTRWLPLGALIGLILRMQCFARFRAVGEE